MELKCFKSVLGKYKATIDTENFEVIIYDANGKIIVGSIGRTYEEATVIMNSEFETLESHHSIDEKVDETLFSKLVQDYVKDKSDENLRHLQTFLFLLKRMEYKNKKIYNAKYYIDILEKFGIKIKRGENYLYKT